MFKRTIRKAVLSEMDKIFGANFLYEDYQFLGGNADKKFRERVREVINRYIKRTYREELQTQVSEYLESEFFIDSFVERINKKQLRK